MPSRFAMPLWWRLIRRFRPGVPPPVTEADVLVISYRAIGDGPAGAEGGMVPLPVFRRQIAWLVRRFELVGADELGRRRSSSGKPIAAITFDGLHPSVVESALPLLSDHRVPATIFVWPPETDREAVEVGRILGRRDLVDVQCGLRAGAEWGGLAPSEAVSRARDAAAAVESCVGVKSTVFAGPAGFRPDARWLAEFEADERLAWCRACVWAADAVNPAGHLTARSRHWVRWSAPARFGPRERVRWHFAPRIDTYYRERSSGPVPRHRARLVANPPAADVASLLRVLHPFRSHHQSPAYAAHLYESNPFRPAGIPAHYGLVSGRVVEAVISAVGVPVREAGVPTAGIALSSWYRLPEVSHPLGAAPVLTAYLGHAAPILSYDPSVKARSAFDRRGWLALPAWRCWGTAKALANGRTDGWNAALVESETVDGISPILVRCWEDMVRSFDLAIERMPPFWAWKFGAHPMAPHRFFAWRAGSGPVAACVIGWENERVILCDLVYRPSGSRDAAEIASFLEAAFRRAFQWRAFTEISAESNQDAVLSALATLGVTRQRERTLYWRPATRVRSDAVAYRSFADADFGIRPLW